MPSGIHIPSRYNPKPATSRPSNSYTPTPGPSRPHHLSKSKPTRDRALVYLGDGATLSQTPGLPSIPGQIGFAGDRPQDGIARPPPIEATHGSPVEDAQYLTQGLMFMRTDSENVVHDVSRHRRRRQNQSARWIQEVIPTLVSPYMQLVRVTKSFRYDPPAPADTVCICGNTNERRLSIMVIRFYVIESIELRICKCTTAATQLVNNGLFPSAPLSPSLAVDIRVLEFVSRLFLNIPPNTTAWCKTVEDFLDGQGYRLQYKDSLRKRFGEALRWFHALQDQAERHVQQTASLARQKITSLDDGIEFGELRHATNIAHAASTASSSTEDPARTGQKRQRRSEDENEEVAGSIFPERPLPRSRPSDYLRRRCPLCFGGKFPRPETMTGPDAIVCVDACFKQKRNKGEKDPRHEHPDSLFLSEVAVQNAEQYTERVRPPQQPRSKRQKKSGSAEKNNDEIEDGYDGPLRVPRSVLATCQESFTAADDQRQKASTQFFSETALMALLCRHDRVLWIVSMTSAGEKQYYTLALIETLFQHLPPTFKVGLLYDIGCQLHQSCVKWGFLGPYLHRLSFAISVFHAFGHQWACQIIYHPRKCIGFGLSDGEGCERLWKSLQSLIPYLRVCGHFHRLYTLDRQIVAAEKESLHKFGEWLLRRSRHTQEKKSNAEDTLSTCGKPVELLRREWANQVSSQTKPLPRQAKNKGKDAIEQTLQLRKARDALKCQIHESEESIADEFSEAYVIAEAELRLPDLQARLEQTQNRIRALERALGVDDRAQLRRMINNPFISARMNARALKIRLREKLRSRKFELDRLERSFRHQINERKVDDHTASSVQRRDPGIQKLARDYNKLCTLMFELKRNGKAPRGAICPEPIELSGLFALDVDDEIWQDIGLNDDSDMATGSTSSPPLWLCDDNVRAGIKAMLELDRCVEEEERLSWERCSIQIWYAEEWKSVCDALKSSDSPDLSYQLELRRKQLLTLLAGWTKSLRSVLPHPDIELPSWGPTEDDILEARVFSLTSSTVQSTQQIDGLGDDFGDEESVLSDEHLEYPDSTLLDTLEAVDLADSFRQFSD